MALLWSNYFALAILALLFAESLVYERAMLRKQLLPLLLSIAVATASLIPLWRAGFADAHGSIHLAQELTPALAARVFYCLFALMASVAVAPWFLPWSIPVAMAGLALLYLLLAEPASRRRMLFFLCLVVGLALANHLDLKRLLFMTPWLVLAVARLCSCPNRKHALAAILSLSIIFVIGWIGIATGSHPATGNFYEPWSQVAQTTAAQARQGALIVSDSTPYFFYLDYALGLEGTPAKHTYLGQAVYTRHGVAVEDMGMLKDSELRGRVVLVEGAGPPLALQMMAETRERVSHSCRLEQSWKSTPDPAFAYKRLLGPSVRSSPTRVVVEDFLCDPQGR